MAPATSQAVARPASSHVLAGAVNQCSRKHPGPRPFAFSLGSCPRKRGFFMSTLSFSRDIQRLRSIDSGSSELPSVEELREAMNEAIRREDYQTAAKLRDQVVEAESADPVISLRMALQQSVDEERFEDAARLRDELLELDPRPSLDFSLKSVLRGKLPTSSFTVTDGVRVKVQSQYVPAQSLPRHGKFLFRYTVTITNTTKEILQLRSRHWIITDATGAQQQVKGSGVVGEQPILNPGKSYEYTSACPINTSIGTMQGEYEFAIWDQPTEDWTYTMSARVGLFGLKVEQDALDSHDAPTQ